MNYRSRDFLTDGHHLYNFNELNYQDKVAILSLEALEKLSTSLESIANVHTLNENVLQIQETNDQLTASNELMQQQMIDLAAEKDDLQVQMTQQVANVAAEKAALQQQIDNQNNNSTYLQGQIVALSENNAALTSQLNNVTTRLSQFENLVRQIDTLTDEAVG